MDSSKGCPIAILPPEILAEIFSLSLPARSGYQKALVLLGLVCKRWHLVVSSTPGLWSTIFCQDPVAIWKSLEMSGNHPLNIIWPNLYSANDHHTDLLMLVCREAPRWRAVLLDLIAATEACWEALVTPAPLLEELRLALHDNPHFQPFYLTGCINLFGGEAPRLQSVVIEGIPAKWESPIFSGLTRIKVRRVDISISEIFRILSASPQLESLQLARLRFNKESTDLTRVTMPRLAEFSAHNLDEESATELVRNLILPAVKSFRLHCGPAAGDGTPLITNHWEYDLLFMIPNLLRHPLTSLHLTCKPSLLSAKAVFQDERLKFDLAARDRDASNWDFVRWLSDATNQPPLDIAMYSSGNFDDATIAHLAHLKNIRSFLTYATESNPILMDHLSTPLEGVSPERWLLPDMTTLTVRRGCSLTNVFEMLQCRYEENSAVLPLAALHLGELKTDRKVLKKIKRFLGNVKVTWNSVEVEEDLVNDAIGLVQI